ncbi:MAG: hypothetical protein Q8N62_02820 [Candidatus Omnitrophota bacterium]|nr:hypothetical protein [Candidatus Omnitrophota bacterium]
MWINILQQLGVLALAVLFSLLFYTINNKEAKIKRARLNKAKTEGELK